MFSGMKSLPRKQKLKIGCVVVASAGTISGCGGAVEDEKGGTDDFSEPEGSGGAWLGTGGAVGALPSGGAFIGVPYFGTGGFVGVVGVPAIGGTGGWGAGGSFGGGSSTGGSPGTGGSSEMLGTGGWLVTDCIDFGGFPNCPVGVPPLGGAGPDDDPR